MKRRCIITGIAGIVCACACIVFGAPHLEVDFDSLATGEIDNGGPTLAQLNAATTGGSWTLNPDAAVTNEIVADGGGQGDLALLSRAGSAKWGARFVLDTPIDIDVDLVSGPMEIRFETATRDSTGFTRDAFWKLYDGTTELVYIELDDGVVLLDGNNLGLLSGGSDTYSVRPWDSTDELVYTIAIEIDKDGNLDLNFSDSEGGTTNVSGSVTIDSTADFDRIETSWTAARATPENGIFLNDIVISKPGPAGSTFRFR